MSTFRQTSRGEILAMQDQANRLDDMGFSQTANLYRGLAWIANAVSAEPMKVQASVKRTHPFVGVVKRGRHDI